MNKTQSIGMIACCLVSLLIVDCAVDRAFPEPPVLACCYRTVGQLLRSCADRLISRVLETDSDDTWLELTIAADDGPLQRAAGIKVLPKTYELDAKVIEFIQHFEEVADGAGYSVRGPDQNHLEATAPGIPKQVIEARSASFRPRDPIGVLGKDFKTPLQSHEGKDTDKTLPPRPGPNGPEGSVQGAR